MSWDTHNHTYLPPRERARQDLATGLLQLATRGADRREALFVWATAATAVDAGLISPEEWAAIDTLAREQLGIPCPPEPMLPLSSPVVATPPRRRRRVKDVYRAWRGR